MKLLILNQDNYMNKKDKFDLTEEELDELEDMEENTEEETDDIVERNREIISLKEPEEKINKKQWNKIIKENFPDFLPIANVVLAGIGQLLIKDIINPFGLILVDKPASGKTLVLNFFSSLDELVYADDNFSPASFVSHAANVKREDLGEIDLLPKIKDKALLVREMAPIFGKHEDQLLGNMSILTRIFDGEGYMSSSGVHSKRGYKGVFMFVFLGASTPIRPRIWKTMSTLGSRLFFINVNSQEKYEEILADQLSSPYQKKVARCQRATANFLRTMWQRYPNGIEWDNDKTDRKYKISIGKIAIMLAKFRGSIGIWETDIPGNFGSKGKKLSHHIPEDEQPDRINQILYNFAQGHAVVNERDYINAKDIKAALKIALESAPFHRTILLKALVRQDGKINSDEVEELFSCSRPTALKEMEFLVVLGLASKSQIADKPTELNLKEKFQWLVDAKDQYPDLFF